MQYRAFISYSHADTKFAAWLQKAIETWRVPPRLRKRLGLANLSPVFRDRSDLSAASSLPESITQSQMSSAVLLVVCSPDAAKSDWVSREIERFRELQPTAPIIPIIADGVPPNCFPPALLHDASGKAVEPIAADARKGFDGRRDALLKIIAGMLNVGFDELNKALFSD